MRLTGFGVWGEPDDRAECVRVVRRAVELDVQFIDTANSYGPHVSEEIIREPTQPAVFVRDGDVIDLEVQAAGCQRNVVRIAEARHLFRKTNTVGRS